MDKKFAIFADIHANIDALEAVVEDARSRSVTDFICVGDIVGYNARPIECVNLIRSLDCFTVRGNHDHYCAFDESLDDFHPMAASVVAWTRRELARDPGAGDWLRALPLHAFHQGMTLVHSTLDMPERWGYVFDAIEAEAHFCYQNTQVCFHGHTHVPAIFEKHGLAVTGRSPDRVFVEMIEIPEHPWFVACQCHPELKSKPFAPHPLFRNCRPHHRSVLKAHRFMDRSGPARPSPSSG